MYLLTLDHSAHGISPLPQRPPSPVIPSVILSPCPRVPVSPCPRHYHQGAVYRTSLATTASPWKARPCL